MRMWEQAEKIAELLDNESKAPAGGEDGARPDTDEIRRRAAACYGETASFRPQVIDTDKSVNDPANWDPESAAKLHRARTTLAGMYGAGVNTIMKSAMPRDPSNPIEKRQWDLCTVAARDSLGATLDPRFENMFHRQIGIGEQVPTARGWEGKVNLQAMGPFVNTAGATPKTIKEKKGIAAGPQAYIDFYGFPKP